MGDFISYWLGGFEGYSPDYLLGIAICSALYVFVPRSIAKNPGPSEMDQPSGMRRRDIAVGLALVAFGTVLGLGRYFGVLNEVQSVMAAAKQWNQPALLDGAARLQSHLWTIVGWNSLPYAIVGSLLLLPLGRLASHRATG